MVFRGGVVHAAISRAPELRPQFGGGPFQQIFGVVRGLAAPNLIRGPRSIHGLFGERVWGNWQAVFIKKFRGGSSVQTCHTQHPTGQKSVIVFPPIKESGRSESR